MSTPGLLFGLALLGATQVAEASATRNFPLVEMNRPAARHTATLLQDGRILIVGGRSSPGNLPTDITQIYDPRLFAGWTVTGSMSARRESHTATLLQNGKVLVVGGSQSSAAELFDPSTEQWTTINGPVDGRRAEHTATLLVDGRVLVAGGQVDTGQIYSAALFDPATETWTTTTRMLRSSASHTATLLSDGRVLVTGGLQTAEVIPDFLYEVASLSSAMVYDPTAETWSPVSAMQNPRTGHTSTLLPNGKVLVMGGLNVHGFSNGTGLSRSTLPSGELFDPSSSNWQTLPELLSISRTDHSATLLPNGKVLLAGGWTFRTNTQSTNVLAEIEIYDLTGTPPIPGENLNYARASHTATLLPDGSVLMAGGWDEYGPTQESAELVQWTQESWTTSQLPTQPIRRLHTTTLLGDGMILVAGGTDATQTLSTAELIDPTSDSLEPTGSLHVPRDRHTATLLPNGRVLVTGGQATNDQSIATTEEYDPRTGEWQLSAPLSVPRRRHTATLLRSGFVLVAGGFNDADGYLASAELYHPGTRTWRGTPPMATPRLGHMATLLPNGKVLVTGGRHPEGTRLDAELYDPVTDTWNTAAPMHAARAFHTASLLPDGTVLVAGGADDVGTLASVEIYHPQSNEWAAAPPMPSPRRSHRTLVLPDGRLLVTGGRDGPSRLVQCDLYDPRFRSWHVSASMTTARTAHTCTITTRGTLIVIGGAQFETDPGAEFFDLGLGQVSSLRPQITALPASIAQGTAFSLTATGLRGHSGGSSGTSRDSPTDYPLLHLRHLQSGLMRFVAPSRSPGWTATSFHSGLTEDFPVGQILVTLVVNAIPSESVVLATVDRTPPILSLVGPSPLAAPLGQTFIDPGATATDEIAGDLSGDIVASGWVDTQQSTIYVRTYSVMDPGGNVSQSNRTIWVTAIAGSPGLAHVSGSVNPQGLPTVAWVEYGRTSTFEATEPQAIGAGYDWLSIAVTLTNLMPNSIYSYRTVSSNSLGITYGPIHEIRTGSYSLPGDGNADGVVDDTELEAVLALYWPTSPWLYMTNVLGLGESAVTFALPHPTAGAFSVEGSTNLLDWQYLGPALPRYEFLDTQPWGDQQRYYRLTWP